MSLYLPKRRKFGPKIGYNMYSLIAHIKNYRAMCKMAGSCSLTWEPGWNPNWCKLTGRAIIQVCNQTGLTVIKYSSYRSISMQIQKYFPWLQIETFSHILLILPFITTKWQWNIEYNISRQVHYQHPNFLMILVQ